MLSVKVQPSLCTPKQAARLSKAVAPLVRTSTLGYSTGIRIGLVASTSRAFSTTPTTQFRDFFPVKETEHIRLTPPAWPHHGFTEQVSTNNVLSSFRRFAGWLWLISRH